MIRILESNKFSDDPRKQDSFLAQVSKIFALDGDLEKTLGFEFRAEQAEMAQAFSELWLSAPDRDRAIIADVCHIVSTRAARLAAAAIVSVVRKTGNDDATVAIDGSVFEKYPHFQADMEDAIEELCADRRRLRLVHAEDGSGKGAALIAAIASQ